MKKILILFHNNFLDNTLGCNSYLFEIARHLKNRGCQVDFFSTDRVWDNFATFDELNAKHGGLITNFFLHRSKHPKGPLPAAITERKYPSERFGLFSIRRTTISPVSDALQAEGFGWMTPATGAELQKVIDEHDYDIIHVHYIQTAEVLKHVRIPPRTRCIYGAQDALYLMMGYYQFGISGLLSVLPRELEVLRLFQSAFCISYDEMRMFKLLLPQVDFRFVPHMLPRRVLPEREKTVDVLFLGFMNPHNKEAVKWFVEKVMPFRKTVWKVAVCGRVWWSFDKDEPGFNALAAQVGVRRIEFAEDLDELYAETRISIVPLLGGTGMKIKTVDSMARGVPVVSTSYGVDGFPDKLENGCLVADDPKTFAAHIDHLLGDAEFYESQRRKTIAYFENHLSRDVVAPVIDELFELNGEGK